MEKIYIKARAKINLILFVLSKRSDNYHNLESIFQKVNLYDEIFIEKIEQDGLYLVTNLKDVKNEDNIIYKAYIKLKKEFPKIKGIKVTLNKKIPTRSWIGWRKYRLC